MMDTESSTHFLESAQQLGIPMQVALVLLPLG